MVLLTKSRYLLGLQCFKLLWTECNDKSQFPEIDSSTQYRFDQGHIIGDYAKKYFPNGIDIPQSDFMGNIRKTKIAMRMNKPIFEGGFMVNELYSRADMLIPNGSSWDIVEVKSSTSVKDIHLHDVAFQKYVYQQSGLTINKCYLMHINNKYVKNGEIEPKKLFTLADITNDIIDYGVGIKEQINKMKTIISQSHVPDIKVSPKCFSPYKCALISKCWDFLEDDNVFDLTRIGIKVWELFNKDILQIKDIPDNFKLTTKQNIQKQCAQSNKTYTDKIEIQKFLKEIEYPLYFLDFETYMTGIPIYDGTRPYQKIPFQFSLHTIEKEGAEVKHISFLAEGKNDPRFTFLISLENTLKEKGSILVYNASFEKSVIAELAQIYPNYIEWAKSIQNRMVDLLIPFKNFWYYNQKQKGSASVKKVLPALTTLSYDDLDINNGEAASLEFIRITHGNATEDEIKKTRKDLEIYCGLDTEALIHILKELKKI